MPVATTRLEPGIYRSRLSGTIPLAELLAAQDQGAALASEHGEQRYVLILDIQSGVQMPFDIREAGQIVENDRSLKILSVGASLHIRFLASLLGTMFGMNRLEHHGSLDKAVQRARALLAQGK